MDGGARALLRKLSLDGSYLVILSCIDRRLLIGYSTPFSLGKLDDGGWKQGDAVQNSGHSNMDTSV